MKGRPEEALPMRRHDEYSYLHVPHHWRSGRVTRLGSMYPHQLELHDARADATYHWSARSHRKHRLVHVQPHRPGLRVKRPRYRLFGFDWTNISWWIAQLFLWGSVAWVINGWFLFLPTGREKLDFYMAGYSALVGGTLFWFGAYLSVVEAVNVDTMVSSPYQLLHMADVEAANNNGAAGESSQQNGTYGKPAASGDTSSNGTGSMTKLGPEADFAGDVVPVAKQRFRWWGWRWHDIGYIAVFLQFIGATFFQVSVITGTPHVLPEESASNWWTWDAAFWALQIIGAWGFIISASAFMLECQDEWYKPAPLRIGWQVGFWNLIGAVGFEASPIGGLLAYPGEVPQRWVTDFQTFYGGWAFLIGSYFQLLECLNKHPTGVGEKDAKPAVSS